MSELHREKIFVGIDPGANGCIVALQGEVVVTMRLADTTDKTVWNWISQLKGSNCFALIEQQTARPTFVPSIDEVGADRVNTTGRIGRSTILASTCMLYGNYCSLRTMLVCAEIPFEDCPPKRWQEGLQIPHKAKGEKDTIWKNKLKAKAEQLYPRIKVTLANADALLIATYCKRKMTHERAESTATEISDIVS